jgi:hypothetical protein
MGQHMLSLKSLEWFTISRGQMVACEIPPGFPQRGDVPADVLKPGDAVLIDGVEWTVRGIEYFMTNPPQLGSALSMLVESRPEVPQAGDPCPRCESVDTWVTPFEDSLDLVCRTCGLGT